VLRTSVFGFGFGFTSNRTDLSKKPKYTETLSNLANVVGPTNLHSPVAHHACPHQALAHAPTHLQAASGQPNPNPILQTPVGSSGGRPVAAQRLCGLRRLVAPPLQAPGAPPSTLQAPGGRRSTGHRRPPAAAGHKRRRSNDSASTAGGQEVGEASGRVGNRRPTGRSATRRQRRAGERWTTYGRHIGDRHNGSNYR
jgi:hypothetical protein